MSFFNFGWATVMSFHVDDKLKDPGKYPHEIAILNIAS